MKRSERLITTLLITVGLVFLTVAASILISPASFHNYVQNFFFICFWLALPIIGFFLFILFKKIEK